ncbi:hypothetical protein Kpol_1048p48 [Vanderwaltozyma polyspora DSM 70294]|uniref:MADS-box domain-containing protein n=1 Tax=Vanderwaltozyma polyspora (strain ATCC 22028 / DSM 70294 / BCRC 21397 / CBS 2163 / NBRC 10782 / NRRL Y-8283 / UCD 57-17) TaxID=436907 RepID=A7TGL0_VANPO|nr:uncharacterized protein Kpol_1048p48 [Vanderwaltozyma polyspora DSM 70294]EDO18617.1 hypothetical protein Kpol_1048p48 [Vanderwaltozyma polyspora DSM 70294]
MGRRKIAIKPITEERNRSVTFIKRKGGLFKKAHELAVLCQVDIAVIILGANSTFYEFSSCDIKELLEHYKNDKQFAHISKDPSHFGNYPNTSESRHNSFVTSESINDNGDDDFNKDEIDDDDADNENDSELNDTDILNKNELMTDSLPLCLTKTTTNDTNTERKRKLETDQESQHFCQKFYRTKFLPDNFDIEPCKEPLHINKVIPNIDNNSNNTNENSNQQNNTPNHEVLKTFRENTPVSEFYASTKQAFNKYYVDCPNSSSRDNETTRSRMLSFESNVSNKTDGNSGVYCNDNSTDNICLIQNKQSPSETIESCLDYSNSEDIKKEIQSPVHATEFPIKGLNDTNNHNKSTLDKIYSPKLVEGSADVSGTASPLLKVVSTPSHLIPTNNELQLIPANGESEMDRTIAVDCEFPKYRNYRDDNINMMLSNVNSQQQLKHELNMRSKHNQIDHTDCNADTISASRMTTGTTITSDNADSIFDSNRINVNPTDIRINHNNNNMTKKTIYKESKYENSNEDTIYDGNAQFHKLTIHDQNRPMNEGRQYYNSQIEQENGNLMIGDRNTDSSVQVSPNVSYQLSLFQEWLHHTGNIKNGLNIQYCSSSSHNQNHGHTIPSTVSTNTNNYCHNHNNCIPVPSTMLYQSNGCSNFCHPGYSDYSFDSSHYNNNNNNPSPTNL